MAKNEKEDEPPRSLMVRLSAVEYEEFAAHARDLGVSLSGWVRMTLRRGLRREIAEK